jgi:hypothetical protein
MMFSLSAPNPILMLLPRWDLAELVTEEKELQQQGRWKKAGTRVLLELYPI